MARNVPMVIMKTSDSKYWPRLLKESGRVSRNTPQSRDALKFLERASRELCLFAAIHMMLNVVLLQNHWLKTDFNKWKDEDDSDVDEAGDQNFEAVRSA